MRIMRIMTRKLKRCVHQVNVSIFTVGSIGSADIQPCSWDDNEVHIEQTRWQCTRSGVSRGIVNPRCSMLGELKRQVCAQVCDSVTTTAHGWMGFKNLHMGVGNRHVSTV